MATSLSFLITATLFPSSSKLRREHCVIRSDGTVVQIQTNILPPEYYDKENEHYQEVFKFDRDKQYLVYFIGVKDSDSNESNSQANINFLRAISEASGSGELDQDNNPFHVGVVSFNEKENRWTIMQSAWPPIEDKSHEIPLRTGMRVFADFTKAIIAQEVDGISIEKARQLMCQPYGYRDILQLAGRLYKNISPELWSDLLSEPKNYITAKLVERLPEGFINNRQDYPGLTCSEFVAKSYANLDFANALNKPPDEVTPADLLRHSIRSNKPIIPLDILNGNSIFEGLTSRQKELQQEQQSNQP